MEIAVIAIAVVAIAAARRPGLARFRALFPSWRLFDRAVASPRLYIRTAARDDDALSPWAPIDPGPRPAASAVLAPRANLALAYQSTIDQLVNALGELDIEDSDTAPAGDPQIETDPRVTGLVLYQLVARIAWAHAPGARRLQWKIVVPGEPADYLISPISVASEGRAA